jgi:hypothetical protein
MNVFKSPFFYNYSTIKKLALFNISSQKIATEVLLTKLPIYYYILISLHSYHTVKKQDIFCFFFALVVLFNV